MSKLLSFIELLVKQTCRRASHEFEMAKGKRSSDHPSNIYSLEFLKSLHDSPRDNIMKLLKDSTMNKEKTSDCLTWLNINDFCKLERNVLLDFLTKVKDMSPSNSQNWIDLQHYLNYVYRNFVNANPDPSAEVLTPFFLGQLRKVVESLLEEDESQLYLRILALLREYCIFAQWNYSKYEGDYSITRLFYYYEAMLSAAKNLSSVFSEFEIIIYKHYSVCWIDFNTAVFIRYFFETEFVQNKVYHCLKTRMSSGDTPAMFGLLEDLKNLWIKEDQRIKKINEEAAIDDMLDYFYIEEAMINSHKKVLTSNFWAERPQKDKDDLDLRRIDHHIFRLLGDPLFHPAGPILDRNGRCICEECLLAKYRCILDTDEHQLNDIILEDVSRLIFCRTCLNLIDLDLLHQHVNNHNETGETHFRNCTNLTRIIPERISLMNESSDSLNLPDLISSEQSSKQQFDENLNSQLASQPTIRTTCDIHYSNFNNDRGDMNCTVFEHFLRSKTSNKTDPLFESSIRHYLKIKKHLFMETGKVLNHYFKQQASQNPITSKKCEIQTDCDRKNREMRKSGYKLEKPYSTTCKSSPKERCDHSDFEEGSKIGVCHGHGYTCDHYKESKECDCTHCEVFGTSVSFHNNKNSDLRDRLRIRLHQRREKRAKNFKPPCVSNLSDTVKVKTTINKVEERVPLPSSPTNIPPAPVVKSTDSLLVSSSTDDIHGLVSYIEGNSGLNKMELAQKKAAKKARQRQKKEEARIKAEEDKKRIALDSETKEKDKKIILAKNIAEKEKFPNVEVSTNQNPENNSRKKIKEGKQKKQLLTKQSEQNIGRVLEENIPATVTIKRIAENGSNPTVTITLKGATPDQDKLLYKLVGGVEENSYKGKKKVGHNTTKSKKQKGVSAMPATKVVTKQMKVTVALDSINKSSKEYKTANKPEEINKELSAEDLPIPMLRLPPGITITKVEGSVSSRSYQVVNMDDKKGSTINVGKAGVIIVDTEKLIPSKPIHRRQKTKATKRKKQKKNENQNETLLTDQNNPEKNKEMVTLKNPIFESFQMKSEPASAEKSANCVPAAIFTNENGMVTIKSSRFHQPLFNGSNINSMPISSLLNLLPDMQRPKLNTNSHTPTHDITEEKNKMSPFSAQEILSGLPGIEITKVDKRSGKPESNTNKSNKAAHVSIIPTSNRGNRFNFEKDDWLYG